MHETVSLLARKPVGAISSFTAGACFMRFVPLHNLAPLNGIAKYSFSFPKVNKRFQPKKHGWSSVPDVFYGVAIGCYHCKNRANLCKDMFM